MKRKTSKGKLIDLEALIANQPVSPPAVGNMNVNANGDILGDGGEVIQNNTNRVRSYYKQNPKSSTHHVSLKDPLEYSTRDSIVADEPEQQPMHDDLSAMEELSDAAPENTEHEIDDQKVHVSSKSVTSKKSQVSKKSSKSKELADIEVVNEQGDIVMMTASEFRTHTQQSNNE